MKKYRINEDELFEEWLEKILLKTEVTLSQEELQNIFIEHPSVDSAVRVIKTKQHENS